MSVLVTWSGSCAIYPVIREAKEMGIYDMTWERNGTVKWGGKEEGRGWSRSRKRR
jgi:hypothetical protein